MIKSYTIEEAIVAAGYADPMTAARQQARMVLLGRLARYQATVKQLEAKWGQLAAVSRSRDMLRFFEEDPYLFISWQVRRYELAQSASHLI